MAGRFPGASDIDEFWQNLCEGRESISRFSDAEVLATGVDPAVLKQPNFVKAGGVLDHVDLFDAAFFGCSPREAKTMDPQHRVFLECAYQALQHAGIDPQRYKGSIGVFSGANTHSYATRALSDDGQPQAGGGMQDYFGNDRNFLSTRVSYKLNLKGPSLTIQTACSTSLVATHIAYQSLLSGECDVALGGGVSIRFPQKTGYFYEREGILSPDGHCRAFDKSAEGTVGSEGVGIVVLKRLADARADGDCIHAVIKGSALNNDGSRKVGFTAPSVEGQADVIARAMAMAEVDPDSIGYVETHGTGTLLGDPIEIAALTRAYRGMGSKRQQYCAIGSLKSNLGHLDSAAGIAGLIKAILTLKNAQIPASLHYEEANPQIDFAGSPFFVNTGLTAWSVQDRPHRAGVSSFGIGGSNVHMVLEEAPRRRTSADRISGTNVLLLSARTESALDRACEELAAHLKDHPELSLESVAFTLQKGRQQFQHRRMLVSAENSEAISALESLDPKRVVYGRSGDERRAVVFMFPGQGSQYVDMGRELYESQAGFRPVFDECCELLQANIGVDLRDLLFAAADDREQAALRLNQTSLTQPALFAVEYSLAKLWMSWGVKPRALIGHSIGEYVAACLAGVFSLADALSLVCARARLMQDLDTGSMLAVPLPADEVQQYLGDSLSVAAINDPSMSVVSGPTGDIDELQQVLSGREIECRPLHTSHAFHSAMMDPVIEPFEKLLRGIEIGEPKISYISNVTGGWITAGEIADPAYWSRHLRATVQFAAGLETLFENPASLFLEVGPGQTLSTLARSHPARGSDHVVVASMRHPQNPQPDSAVLMTALGRLWLSGIDVDWSGFYRAGMPEPAQLPGYPFERESFWIEQRQPAATTRSPPRVTGKRPDPGQWFYAPGWKSAIDPLLHNDEKTPAGRWLIFSDGGRLAENIIGLLADGEREIIVVTPGDSFTATGAGEYCLQPGSHDDMAALFAALRQRDAVPETILHLWSAAPAATPDSDDGSGAALEKGFYTLLHLAQVLSERALAEPLELVVVACGTHSVNGDETLYPQHAALSGLCRVIPQEQDRVRCRSIDIEASNDGADQGKIARRIIAELSHAATDPVVALRNSGRWIPEFEAVTLDETAVPPPGLRQNGVYLITGGLGNIGLQLGQYLARAVSARLVLLGRSELGPRSDWDDLLAGTGKSTALGRKILAVRALEDAGAEVLVLSADVADAAQMREAIEQVSAKFGQIDGVIHAAGATGQDSFRMLRDLDRAACERHFLPKIRGVQVLDQALEGHSPDFCILMSSLASLLGGLRFAAYASANAFLDAFARSRAAGEGLSWLSVNWDGWQFGDPDSSDNSTVAGLAMTASEGVDVFSRLLQVKAIPRLVVSTSDLQARLDQWTRPQQKAAVADGLESGASSAGQSGPDEIDFTQAGIEKRLCAIWSGLLGVDGIAVDDNFFDLGGDSLLALQVTSRLRESRIADLSTATVLESPTIAELTRRILKQHQQTVRDEQDKTAELLQKIKSITPEEKEKLLQEARQAQSVNR
nr:putative NRPS/PKS hybrid synthase module B7B [uncultured bacterium]